MKERQKTQEYKDIVGQYQKNPVRNERVFLFQTSVAEEMLYKSGVLHQG